MNTKLKLALKTITVSLTALLIVTTATYAIGTLTPSGTAGDATQYTLNDIYTKLTTNAATSTKSGSFTTPGTVAASFRTLTEIYDAIPTIDATKVATGTSYLGVTGTLTTGLPKTGQTTSYTANDDGDLERGITLSYTDNGNGTVTDNVTGLVWQQDGAYNASSWQDAIDYCANNVATLPGSGWRLPNYKELVSIVDLGRVGPAIDPIFTNTQSDYYWSSTTYHDYSVYAWFVSFYGGSAYSGDKADGYIYARCVR